MVKGISKQVIVVRAPICSMFDQAIFILKEDALSGTSIAPESILREACAVADNYVREHCEKSSHKRKRSVLGFIIGAVILSLAAIMIFSFAF